MSGGQPAIRGFLVQTLIALLDALKDKAPWTSVTLEPNLTSDKVDILWAYRDGSRKAVQVKSSQNPFRKAEVEQWAADLQKDKQAGRYELLLVGPTTPAVATLGRVGDVAVPVPKNLDLAAFKSDAAHQLHGLLPKLGLPRRPRIRPSTCGNCWRNPPGSTSAACRSAPGGPTVSRSRSCTSR